MKVGIYVGNLKPTEGGGFTYLDSILSAFEMIEGFEFIVFSYSQRPSSSKLKWHVLANPSFPFRVFKKIKNRFRPVSNLETATGKIGVDFIWYPTYEFEESRLPYACTVWDLQHRRFPFFPEIRADWESREARLKAILHKASFVITGTPFGAMEICNQYSVDERNIKVLPFTTPQDCLKSKDHSVAQISHKLPEEFFFYPAQFWAHKNHILILKAMRYLQTKGIEFNMVFTGADKGNWTYLEDWIQVNNLEDRVWNLGFVDRGVVLELYEKSQGLIFPSFFGPDNIPPLEAMSLGTPVLASRLDGAHDQLGENATYFDLFDHVNLAEKIQSLLIQGPDMSKLKKAKKLAESLNTEFLANKIKQILEEFSLFQSTWGSDNIN